MLEVCQCGPRVNEHPILLFDISLTQIQIGLPHIHPADIQRIHILVTPEPHIHPQPTTMQPLIHPSNTEHPSILRQADRKSVILSYKGIMMPVELLDNIKRGVRGQSQYPICYLLFEQICLFGDTSKSGEYPLLIHFLELLLGPRNVLCQQYHILGVVPFQLTLFYIG